MGIEICFLTQLSTSLSILVWFLRFSGLYHLYCRDLSLFGCSEDSSVLHLHIQTALLMSIALAENIFF